MWSTLDWFNMFKHISYFFLKEKKVILPFCIYWCVAFRHFPLVNVIATECVRDCMFSGVLFVLETWDASCKGKTIIRSLAVSFPSIRVPWLNRNKIKRMLLHWKWNVIHISFFFNVFIFYYLRNILFQGLEISQKHLEIVINEQAVEHLQWNIFRILLESIKNWPKTMSNIEQLIIFVENLT